MDRKRYKNHIFPGWALYHLNEYQDAIDCFNRVDEKTEKYCFLPWKIKGIIHNYNKVGMYRLLKNTK